MAPSGMASFSHFGFVPLPNFSMIAFSNAIEVLRMANYLNNAAGYQWSVFSPAGGPVMASNGLSIETQPLESGPNADFPDVLLVCGGVEVAASTDNAVLSLLRAAAKRGVALGSLCTGAYALAKAGLLDGYQCAVHWENWPSLQEVFPRVRFTKDLFVIDRDRLTCTGGIAPLDMMLGILRHRLGTRAVAAIADQFILDHMRDTADQQPVPLAVRMGAARQALVEVVALMEANIEEPLTLEELARLTGISERQMQRMFRDHLDVTPIRYYLSLRLRHARDLLRHSSMPVMSIMLTCGFQSACHFSKAYREMFGNPPSAERRKYHSAHACTMALLATPGIAFTSSH